MPYVNVLEINCATGQAVSRPLTADELTNLQNIATQAAAQEQAAKQAAQQKATDLALVLQKAQTDPAFAALHRLLTNH